MSIPARSSKLNARKIAFVLFVLLISVLWAALSVRLSIAGLETGAWMSLLGAWGTSGIPGLLMLGSGIRARMIRRDVGPTELLVIMPGTGPLKRRQLRDPVVDKFMDRGTHLIGTWLISVGFLILIAPLTVTVYTALLMRHLHRDHQELWCGVTKECAPRPLFS